MKPAHRRQLGIGAGVVLGAAAVFGLNAPGCEGFHAPGPMNTDHDRLACEACHRAAPGTVRQQLQTAARAWIVPGAHAGAAVDVGYRAVTNTECLACHERPEDRHPVFRFLEPRFANVRERIAPERCVACHREHNGVRITAVELGYCRHCHEDVALEQDPLDVPHRALAADGRWDSCLGCHDYHGNHAHAAPRRLDAAIDPARIADYFTGGPSPYGPPIHRAIEPEVTTP